MATTKIWAVKNNPGRVIDYANDPTKTCSEDLASVLDYAKNEDKTEHEYYTEGLNCDPSSALSDFYRVKDRFRKRDGILAYHAYMSFAPGECTPEEAMRIGTQFAKEQWGDNFQVVITEHLNTDCLHCHFVINSVAYTDGHKLRDDEKNWYKFRYLADEICKSNGKSTIETPEERKKLPTKREIQIKNLLDKGIAATDDVEGLKDYLERRGCVCDFEHKHWTVTPKGWTKPYRIERLADKFDGAPDYSKDGILYQYEHPEVKVLPKPKKVSNKVYSSREDLTLRYINPNFMVMMALLTLIRKRWLHYLIPIKRYQYEYQNKTRLNQRAFQEIETFKRDYRFIRTYHIKTQGDVANVKQKLLEEKAEIERLLGIAENRIEYEGETKALAADVKIKRDKLRTINKDLETIKRLQTTQPAGTGTTPDFDIEAYLNNADREVDDSLGNNHQDR